MKMKHFYFLSSLIYILTFTPHTFCMLHILTKNRSLAITPAQRRHYTTLTHLQKRMDVLERQQDVNTKEITELKAIVSRWNKDQSSLNYENLPRTYDPSIDRHTHDGSFTNECGWDHTFYGNR